MVKDHLSSKINQFISGYLVMDLGTVKINCPYWRNRLRDGKVVVRGQFNGKGDRDSIFQALKKGIDQLPTNTLITQQFVFKLAKRERIGIDCSGLVYRTLDYLVRSKPTNKIGSLDDIFVGGINKTNVRRLTDNDKTIRIKKAVDVIPADLIRIMGGRHVLLVVRNNSQYIEYVHASDKSTYIRGVHKGRIYILNPNRDLDEQEWQEKTPSGENYGKKYFNSQIGDGIRRLKYFQNEYK